MDEHTTCRAPRAARNLLRRGLAGSVAAAVAAVVGAPATASAADPPPAVSVRVTVPVLGQLGLAVGGPGGSGVFGSDLVSLNDGTATTREDANRAIGADVAHLLGYTGRGVDVAIVDTGVAPVAGLAVAGAVVNGPDLSLDFQAGMPASVDAHGHGTHLAGIVAGRDAGVAPGARLVNVKAGAADGAVDVSQVIAAIDWVVTHRRDAGVNIRVLNLAFGTDGVQARDVSPLAHAVESAWRNGIVVVVSAGNGGGLLNPAIDPFVLTVGAADVNQPLVALDDERAPFSSVGTVARPVDLLAPGQSIVSLRTPGSTVDRAYPGAVVTSGRATYLKGSGTSQAAAFVSGAVALLLQQRPGLTPDQVKAILTSSADPLLGVPPTEQGRGVLDVDGALSTPTPPAALARQRPAFSTGLGSIEADRGTAHLVADDGTTLRGEVDLQGAAWQPRVWAPRSTLGTAWVGGTWNGNTWAGNAWTASSSGNGVQWSGRSWRSELWAGRSWRADLWAGRSWRAELWAGRSWRNGTWG